MQGSQNFYFYYYYIILINKLSSCIEQLKSNNYNILKEENMRNQRLALCQSILESDCDQIEEKKIIFMILGN